VVGRTITSLDFTREVQILLDKELTNVYPVVLIHNTYIILFVTCTTDNRKSSPVSKLA
jgi:hypothetical protein